MCGIFYIKANNFLIQKILNNLDFIIEKIKYRGPDKVNILHENDLLFVHTLLAIQGFNPQPKKTSKGGYIIFNGEIYGTSINKFTANDSDLNFSGLPYEFNSELDFLEDYFEKKDGLNKMDEIDGEFVINYVDKEKNVLNILTDPFFTKPYCYYSDNDIFIGSSYESCVKKSLDALGINGNIIFLHPNTHYQFNLTNNSLIFKKEIVKWDFEPKYSNFDRWTKAFENSLKKRTNTDKGIFIPLSSGYDSGCIVSGLLKMNKNFKTYTFKGQENIDILEKRKKLILDNNNSFYYVNPIDNIEEKYKEYCKRIENYTSYHYYGEPYANIYDAYSCFGIYQIFQEARKGNQIIFLSGHGGDEILSDYGNIENRSASILDMNYTNVRSKWPNFDGGYGRNIIQMFERVAGCFGIESRYPFLDKQLVQEFLWMTDDIKNSEFKQCIANYMRQNNFPFLENKKCSVRVITDDEGGNDYFFKVALKVKKELDIVNPVFKDAIPLDKSLFRPNLNYKPDIKYFP